ncbi:hypothetical protein [Actinomycetospora chibensis]|uniref:Integral membrane protein n=1 Tax=Actinomycetospora chibensis TaxID=663606 RepID=A0ABV9RS78_9PSEU
MPRVSTINGLPAHILVVHAVVVLIPLSALLVVLVAVWPAARARLVWPTAVLAVLALVAVPLTSEAGEWLEQRVARTPLVRAHTELGDYMLPWATGLALVALGLLARQVLEDRGARAVRGATGGLGRSRGDAAVTVVVALIAVIVAAGSVLTVYRIGDSGAQAAWTGQFSEQAQLPPGGGPPPDGE